MVKRASIEFVPVTQPITERVTKFGGQPVWLTEPQWPLSRTTGQPMQFICQIALTPDLFGETQAQMAYIFITGDGDEGFMDGTWDAEGGENAVILQPGPSKFKTQPLTHGPTLYAIAKRPYQVLPQPMPAMLVEFAVTLNFSEDPDFVDERERWKWDDDRQKTYANQLSGNKLGGTPLFVQGAEFPIENKSQLLLQLDSEQVPFFVNFGDAGVGYAFISDDAQQGKFLWQCY